MVARQAVCFLSHADLIARSVTGLNVLFCQKRIPYAIAQMGTVFSFLPFCIAASFSVLILIVKALVKALATTCDTCLTAGGHVSMH